MLNGAPAGLVCEKRASVAGATINYCGTRAVWPPVAIYSIGDLAKLSGVKAHTLRVWESRYKVLEPKRTAANVRYYDDEDVRHLLNVALLNRDGMRISEVAALDRAELQRRVAELSDVSDEYATQLDALTLSMLEMDAPRFERLLSQHIRQHGFEQAMATVIFPFLDKLGVLWMTGSVKPVQEAFASAIIRRKLMVAVEGLPDPPPGAPTLLLFLPEGESQEMSLLLLHYLARARGVNAVYLGRDVSVSDLADAAAILHPSWVFTMLTETFVQDSAAAYARDLGEACPTAGILLSGYQVAAQNVTSDGQTTVLPSLADAVAFFDLNGPRGAAAQPN